jgi:prepilin-type N-terminal cleavage/methylation domain-containing protein
MKKIIAGFTLIEIIMVVAIMGILAGLAVPIYQYFQVRNDLDVAVNTVVASLRRAQALSQAVDGDISWGVKIQSGSIVLFKGTSYAGRDSNFDEAMAMTSAISPGGLQEIVFNKLSGEPQTIGTTTLTLLQTNEKQDIFINQKGTIQY